MIKGFDALNLLKSTPYFLLFVNKNTTPKANFPAKITIPLSIKMIEQTFASFSPSYIAGGAALLILSVQVWIRVRYALKVRAAGGVHAPAIAKDPFTGAHLRAVAILIVLISQRSITNLGP